MQIKEEIWNYTNLRAKIILCLKKTGGGEYIHALPCSLYILYL